MPHIRRQTPVLPQGSASTRPLFVEPDDILEDMAGNFVYKPEAPRSATLKANLEAHDASPTPALASTIARSTSLNSSISSSEASSDE